MSMSSQIHCNTPGAKMEVEIRDQRHEGRPDTIALNINATRSGVTDWNTVFVNPAQLEIIADEIYCYLDKLQQEKMESVASVVDAAIDRLTTCG